MFDALVRDLRFAVRLLRRTPLFTLTATLSLAIGIAGNAAIFSLADAVLRRPAGGLTDPSTLVNVGRTDQRGGFDTLSYPNYIDLRRRNTVFSGLAAYRDGEPFGLATTSAPVRVYGGQVSANFFTVLGVPMALGRSFLPQEEDATAPSLVVVLADRLWRRQFNSDANVIGRTVRLNGRVFTVVGVAPPEFVGANLAAEDLWIPLTSYPEGSDMSRLTERRASWLQAIARLAPGVSIEQARSEMTRIARDLEREYPDANRDRGVAVASAGLVPPIAATAVFGFFGVLFALVGLILLIACANVGGMLLARGVTRARELSMRLALGADQRRLVRLLLAECLLFGAGGSVAGLGLAFVAIRLMRGMVPLLPIELAIEFRLDWRVVA